MNNLSSPILPPPPPPPSSYSPSQSNTISQQTSSQQPQQNIQQPYQDMYTYLQGYNNYIYNFYSAVIPRIEEYEKNQEKILIVLGRERLLEKSTQTLLSFNWYCGILLPIIMIVIFVLFCLYYAPDEVKSFFKEYKVVFTFLSGGYILSLIKPLFHMYSYNNRLNAIEKKLKLNGNE